MRIIVQSSRHCREGRVEDGPARVAAWAIDGRLGWREGLEQRRVDVGRVSCVEEVLGIHTTAYLTPMPA
jgi:hypothetical protein